MCAFFLFPLSRSLARLLLVSRKREKNKQTDQTKEAVSRNGTGSGDLVVYCTGLQGEKEWVAGDEAKEENACSCCRKRKSKKKEIFLSRNDSQSKTLSLTAGSLVEYLTLSWSKCCRHAGSL